MDKRKLQDTTDYLYFDHIELDGKIGKAKFAYNSGQMMLAAALLFQRQAILLILRMPGILRKRLIATFLLMLQLLMKHLLS